MSEPQEGSAGPPRKVSSDLPFYSTMVGIGGLYVLLIVAMLAAMASFSTVGHFVEALEAEEIQYAIRLSLISCTLTTILSLWVAVPIGYLMSRYEFRGKNAVDALLDIPIVLPPLVIGLALLILFQFPLWYDPVRLNEQAVGSVLSEAKRTRGGEDGADAKSKRGAAAHGIAVTRADNTHGNWQFSTDGGETWRDVAEEAGEIADLSAAPRLLAAEDLIRFVPNDEFVRKLRRREVEDPQTQLNYRRWDGTTGEAGETLEVSEAGLGSGSPLGSTVTTHRVKVNPPAPWTLERLLSEKLSFPVTFAVPAVILAQFMVACAFAVRTMRVSFDQINPRREQVALTLGCTRGQAFSMVVLPEAKRGMLTAATLAWARALGEFGPILVFAGATRMRTEVLPTSVFLELSVGNIEAAVAVSLIMVVAAAVVLMIARLFGLRRLV